MDGIALAIAIGNGRALKVEQSAVKFLHVHSFQL